MIRLMVYCSYCDKEKLCCRDDGVITFIPIEEGVRASFNTSTTLRSSLKVQTFNRKCSICGYNRIFKIKS